MFEDISVDMAEQSSHKYGLRILTVSIPENTLSGYARTCRAAAVFNPWFALVAVSRFYARIVQMSWREESRAIHQHDVVAYSSLMRRSAQVRNV